MNHKDNPIDEIIKVLFIGCLIILIASIVCAVCFPHEIKSTDDKVTALQGTYFTIEWNGKPYIVTAGHCVRSMNGTGIAKYIQVDYNWKKYDVEVIKYDRKLDLAILEMPNELRIMYTVETEYYPVGTPIGIEACIYQVPEEVTFHGFIASNEFSAPPMWKYVQSLDIQSGSGSSGSPVCLRGTNKVVGILVGGYPDRDLTFMVPSVRLIEFIEGR